MTISVTTVWYDDQRIVRYELCCMPTYCRVGKGVTTGHQRGDRSLLVNLQILRIEVRALVQKNPASAGYFDYDSLKPLQIIENNYLGQVDADPFDVARLVTCFGDGELRHIGPTRPGKLVQLLTSRQSAVSTCYDLSTSHLRGLD